MKSTNIHKISKDDICLGDRVESLVDHFSPSAVKAGHVEPRRVFKGNEGTIIGPARDGTPDAWRVKFDNGKTLRMTSHTIKRISDSSDSLDETAVSPYVAVTVAAAI